MSGAGLVVCDGDRILEQDVALRGVILLYFCRRVIFLQKSVPTFRDRALASQSTKNRWHARSLRLPNHQTLARKTSRPPPALLAADAEWRQGLHHAGRDRLALRGPSRRFQQGRPEDRGIPLAESERQ